MRSSFSHTLYLLLFVGLLLGCQKVIQVDLNSQDPKFVIEALFTLNDSVHTVSITKTLNIYDGIANPTIDNAVVTIVNTVGKFRLAGNLTQWEINNISSYGINFDCKQAY